MFSTTRRCRNHPGDNNQHDLDSEIDTPERALATLGKITGAEASKLMFEHAKLRWATAESMREATRDKAKVIIGATTVAFAIVTAVATQTLAISTKPSWPQIFLLVGSSVVVAHFMRALVLSLRAITRDALEAPSTQRWAEILRGQDVENGEAYTSLAAEMLSATSRTNELLRERVNRVILAQTSFTWALILSPLLLIASAAVTGRHDLGRDQDILKRLQGLEVQSQMERGNIREFADRLNKQDEQLRVVQYGLKAESEKIIRQSEVHGESPGRGTSILSPSRAKTTRRKP